MQRRYNHKSRKHDRSVFTDDIVWITLRLVWANTEYWLSANELLFIGCHLGPEFKTYFHTTDADGHDVFEPIARRDLPALEASVPFERVMVHVTKGMHGRHFSKILTGTTWSQLELTPESDSESMSSPGVSTRSSEDEETSSTDYDRQNAQSDSMPSTSLATGQENPEGKLLASSKSGRLPKPMPYVQA